MVDKKCINCRQLKKHYAKGLCKNCYKKINLNKKNHSNSVKKWRDKNPEYFKDYYLIQKQLKMVKEK